MPSTVLIITNDHDEHASAVIRELNTRDVPVFRFHPEDLPHACSISIGIRDGRIDGEIRNAYHRVGLNDVCAAWFRRARNLFADLRALTPPLTSERLRTTSPDSARATLCEGVDTPLWVGQAGGGCARPTNRVAACARQLPRLALPRSPHTGPQWQHLFPLVGHVNGHCGRDWSRGLAPPGASQPAVQPE